GAAASSGFSGELVAGGSAAPAGTAPSGSPLGAAPAYVAVAGTPGLATGVAAAGGAAGAPVGSALGAAAEPPGMTSFAVGAAFGMALRQSRIASNGRPATVPPEPSRSKISGTALAMVSLMMNCTISGI